MSDARPPSAPDLPRHRTLRWVALLAAVVAVSVGHYLTPPAHFHWHEVYQRLYYIPILFAAFWFGLRGGLGIALLTSALYLPHIVLHWGHEPWYRWNQLAEILMFFAVSAVAGTLIDRVRAEREQHRRTAEELAHAYERLQSTFERMRLLDRLSALGALSAGMAHEIKNPLGAMLGSIEILESKVPAGHETREFVAILKKELERLSALVTRQLELARPERSDRGPQDVGAIVRSVVELARKQAENQGVTLDLRLAPGLPTLVVDGAQLRQATLNLVLNAIQARPRGGRVEVGVTADAERVVVSVADDGPGLTPESLRRAFEPFYTTKERGTGLGLSIAFQVAAQHGGDLTVHNREEGGACFRLEIPLAPAALAESAR